MAALMPAPSIGDHRRELGALRGPAQRADRLGRARDQHRGIARPPLALEDRHLAVCHRPRLRDHLAHREALAGAEAEHLGGVAGLEPFQPEHMRVDQVRDVDIIADAGAVGGGIVRAEDGQRRAPPVDRVEHQRDQVRLGAVEFADLGLRVAARHVEIAEDHRAQPVAVAEVAQDVLDRPLRTAIGVDRHLPGGLVQHHPVLVAIGGAGRGEDEIEAAGGDCRLDQGE
ncbi:hypothetical protein SDC9_06496 [bioreactor metagenome]|uniref:Uncharacterized protein n=1 Tax=bioreactor metagenome TaxID=1076179 RepID=A0A644T4T5_9ZZZZ